MPRARLTVTATAAGGGRFLLRIGEKTHDLSARRLFSVGHYLLATREYEAAARIFEALARSGQDRSRAVVMLARCRAGLKEYEACEKVLTNEFGKSAVAEELHAAFVYCSLGGKPDAIRELARITDAYPDLPTPCLLLGDLLAAIGMRDKAALAWQLAIQRDRRGGPIARTAREQLIRRAKGGKRRGEDKP